MKFHTRGFTSLAVALASLVLGVSGVILFFSPKGRVAHWTDWTLLGVTKDDWQAIHINVALLFLFLSGFHLYFNWKAFWGYFKAKAAWALNLKTEIAAALLVTGLVVAGALAYVPPFGSIIELKSQSEAYWERNAPRAPAPHAEEFTFGRLARSIGLSVEEVIESLRAEGFDVAEPSMTVREVAEQQGVAPSDVFAAITKHHPEAGKRRGGGQGRGRGGGRGRELGR
jgi:hypothetical protein